MILDSRQGVGGVLVNADTGQKIPFARWADTETGEYEAFRIDPDVAVKLGIKPDEIVVKGKARLKFFPSAPAPPRAFPIPGVQRASKVQGMPIVMVPGQECEIRGCHKLASWKTQDVQETEPHEENGHAYKTLANVKTHFFCDWHYRFPVITSIRGVEKEFEAKARPA